MTPWAHQLRCVDEVVSAIARGERRICVTIPTGGGKTWVMFELARRYLDLRKKVILYTNRRMLLEQTSDVLMDAGLYHGVRAAGYDDERDYPFQLSSIHTEHSRVMRGKTWHLHEADLAEVDEGHLHTGVTSKAILDAHYNAGAVVVLFTATPIGMADVADTLIVGATNSELRACGALVPAYHVGCDEPDLRQIKKVALTGDLSENQVRKLMGEVGSKKLQQLHGRVLDWFDRLNPEHRPTILFAPGVPESRWFAEEFTKAGIPAAHIDGEEVWINGEAHRSNSTIRGQILADSKAGRIRVVCNRYVLREGIDAPWLSHGILATVFGSFGSYLQSGGRLLRAHPGLEHVTIQDHGGNWWRHGSLNEDRHWELDYTAELVASLREDSLRKKTAPEPFRCPGCGRIWLAGTRCNPARGGCGFELDLKHKSRPVVQADGSLKEMKGDIFRARRISQCPDGPKIWESMYWRSRQDKGRRTFRQAAALFAQENNWGWPDPSWPLMPTRDRDWSLLVEEVPLERLTSVPATMQPR